MLAQNTYEYLKPTDEQLKVMQAVREASATYSSILESLVPDGPDKTYLLRKHREVAMWANVAITRLPDGTARS